MKPLPKQWILDQMQKGGCVHFVYFKNGIEYMLHVIKGKHLATQDISKVTCKKCLFALTFPGLADYLKMKLSKQESEPAASRTK